MNCVECSSPLRWAWEVTNGCLCSSCGPGSSKAQQNMRRPGGAPQHLADIVRAGGELPPGSIPAGQTLRVDDPMPGELVQAKRPEAKADEVSLLKSELAALRLDLKELVSALKGSVPTPVPAEVPPNGRLNPKKES